MTQTAGRGPDQTALALANWYECVQKIKAAGVTIERERDRMDQLLQTLVEDEVWEKEPPVPWTPGVRKHLEELRRRHEPDVESVLPESLKAVV